MDIYRIDDTKSPLLSKEAANEEGYSSIGKVRRWGGVTLIACALHYVLFFSSLVMLAISYSQYVRGTAIINQPLGGTVQSLQEISEERLLVQFNSSVFGSSKYRGPPSPEVEAAWVELFTPGMLRITREEMLRAGGTDTSVKFPEEYGGGYRAILEWPHQIHCVYTLWLHTWPSYSNSIELGAEDPSSIFRQHLDHCADVLRQSLLCNADSALITYNWIEHLSHATPNFNTMHQCKDHEAMYKWQEENRVDLPKEALKKPADATQLPTFP